MYDQLQILCTFRYLLIYSNKFKNPYEIFTLGSTSKYDQFGNVIGTGLGMYIIASTVREYNGDYKLTQIQNGFGLEIRIPL